MERKGLFFYFRRQNMTFADLEKNDPVLRGLVSSSRPLMNVSNVNTITYNPTIIKIISAWDKALGKFGEPSLSTCCD